jgi:hypothetical protein
MWNLRAGAIALGLAMRATPLKLRRPEFLGMNYLFEGPHGTIPGNAEDRVRPMKPLLKRLVVRAGIEPATHGFSVEAFVV